MGAGLEVELKKIGLIKKYIYGFVGYLKIKLIVVFMGLIFSL